VVAEVAVVAGSGTSSFSPSSTCGDARGARSSERVELSRERAPSGAGGHAAAGDAPVVGGGSSSSNCCCSDAGDAPAAVGGERLPGALATPPVGCGSQPPGSTVKPAATDVERRRVADAGDAPALEARCVDRGPRALASAHCGDVEEEPAPTVARGGGSGGGGAAAAAAVSTCSRS
jgi:hypothetical protein